VGCAQRGKSSLGDGPGLDDLFRKATVQFEERLEEAMRTTRNVIAEALAQRQVQFFAVQPELDRITIATGSLAKSCEQLQASPYPCAATRTRNHGASSRLRAKMRRSAASICLIVGCSDDWFSRKYPTIGPLVTEKCESKTRSACSRRSQSGCTRKSMRRLTALERSVAVAH
jgi:hypothetical protein